MSPWHASWPTATATSWSKRKSTGRLAYNQPAGHLDDFESLQHAAVRETREETGWTVALTHLIGVHQWRSSEHGDVVVRFSFAARPVSHDPQQPLDKGIRRALWLTRREIADLGERLRSPMVLMSIDDWLAASVFRCQSWPI